MTKEDIVYKIDKLKERVINNSETDKEKFKDESFEIICDTIRIANEYINYEHEILN